ncbi:MAG: penicillin-binding protein 1C [Pseudomonadota bacterium]
MGLLTALVALTGWLALDRWVAATDLPALSPEVSTVVLDREGRLLRAYQVADGRWRLPVAVADVDRTYLDMLMAYEDKRFHSHPGVDLAAMGRALGQAMASGEIVSGASTLTMQVARLLVEQPTGSIRAKIRQIRVALALERVLSKDEILQLYLTLAPFGGNIEGVRAASLAWFGKEPRRLTPAEAALLVALPQAPEARRPDRARAQASAARDRVLARAVGAGALAPGDARAARRDPVPDIRRRFPIHAPHLADRTHRKAPGRTVHHLSLDRDLQHALEALVRERMAALPGALSAAVLVADHRTGEILASVGSAGLFETGRRGWIDMTRAVRSPGSTLKPLIYGIAFENGIAHPESLIDDRPTRFGTYTPTNFNEGYHGTLSVRAALQRSLNVPTVTLLDAIGPAQLMTRMRRARAPGVLPPGRAPGLAIGLGGIGMSLHDLVTLYAAMARGGEAVALRTDPDGAVRPGRRILSRGAAWQVADILAGAPAPVTASNHQLAYKTGTSYGHRDAWAIGFDGRHVIGVWVGRADAAAVPGITGIRTAAPILFEALSRLKPGPDRLSPPPPDVLTVAHAELPRPLRHVHGPRGVPDARQSPEIVFPPNGARVDLGLASGPMDLAVKIRRGAPPFTWLVNGRPVATRAFDREVAWTAQAPGYVSISVVDAAGLTARTRVFVE